MSLYRNCFGSNRGARNTALCATVLALYAASAHGQEGNGSVTGLIRDPSGASVSNATVTLQPTGPGSPLIVKSASDGRYNVFGSSGKTYTIVVQAEGFGIYTSKPIRLAFEEQQTLDIVLKIEEAMQTIDVSDENSMDTDPAQNGDAITLKGKDIDALPMDSNTLLLELQGLAGSNSPDLYVNGFSGGTLPPRDTIREIRINQNPYSAQNDTNPVNGQIQIFTKPGSDKLHGDFYAYGNDSPFNSLNPFVTSEPAYHSASFYSSVNGPINKRASFFVNGGHNLSDSNAIVSAQVLDPTNTTQTTFSQAVSTPSSGYDFSARVDMSVGAKSTVIARYNIDTNSQTNGGIGQLVLPTQGYNSSSVVQTLQLSNSQIVTAKIINDTRLQYQRSRVHQSPDSYAPAIVVQGAFTGGGNNGGQYNDNQDRFELQNYWSASEGKQYMTFGGRLRSTRDANHSLANYNGQYIFATLAAYQATVVGLAAGQSFATIQANGGGPSQFSLTTGQPGVAVTVVDAGLFFQDDIKLQPNLTLSTGLRFETQNQIADKADFAPRLGISWGFRVPKNKPPTYILRGGAGLFYKRFTSGNVLQAARENGTTQQQYIVNLPAFYLPNAATLPASLLGGPANSTRYQISPDFHSPYYFSGTVSLQRQLGTHGSITESYLEGRGMHGQLTRNINAPLPGTYNPAVPTSGTRPFGGTENIYEYESEGTDRSHRLSTNMNLRFRNRYFLWGYYQFKYNSSDASGGFPSNQYYIRQDYGRTANDNRHEANFGGNAQLPYGFHTYGYMRVASSVPFNITLGQDLNGDSQFNDRPTFATDLTRASVVKTSYGNFDTAPIAGQTIIPINYGHGPGFVTVNLAFGRSFAFGPVLKAPAGSPAPVLKPGQKPEVDHRFALEFTVEADNVFNHPNFASPIGTLNSPLFGRSVALNGSGNNAANRVVNLQTYFHF